LLKESTDGIEDLLYTLDPKASPAAPAQSETADTGKKSEWAF
jgi:hypothetical protein